MTLQGLIEYENVQIRTAVCNKYCADLSDVFNFETEGILQEINADLLDVNNGTALQMHNKLILNLIFTYLSDKGAQEFLAANFECDGETEFAVLEGIKTLEIPTLCEELHIAFLNSKFEFKNGKFLRGKSKNNLIEKGAVYTKQNIVREIVETTIDNYYQLNQEFSNLSILDFACGTGRFYEQIIETLSKYNITKQDSVLKHIYAIDLDSIAINITRLKALSYLSEITAENISIVSNKIILRNALMRNNIFDTDTMALKNNDLNGLINARFDVIVSNPPYLVLKANKNKANSEFIENIQKQVSYFRNSGMYHYSIEGMLNYYQLSIEAILSMVKPNGEIGIICPSSLFADISATKLRKHLLLNNKVRKITYFAENEQLFENVTQATNIFYLQKNGKTSTIEVMENDKVFNIDLELVKQLFPKQMEIPFITQLEWQILKKMSETKKLKQINNVRNRRGELDLTLFKSYITKQNTPFRLVRGNMIAEKEIKDINGEFVSEEFIKAKTSDFIANDFRRKRLICQQISNSGLKKRLKFVFSHETDILGNSCNYISSDEMTLKKLYLLLNSNILNWRFKITSTNNHINNYELDELPIADLNQIDENYQYETQEQLDEYVGSIYGLSTQEIRLIAQK